MADELKIKRGHKRTAFTKSMNKLRRAVSMNNDCTIPDLLIATQRDFDALQLAHDEYHDTLTEDIAISESERYFEELDNSYSVALQKCSLHKETATKSCDNMLAHVLSLPRMEIQKFDGNPLNYSNFIAVFDECVDKPISDCQTKLMRLFQFTTGDANYAIRACVSVGGSEGYSEARDILKNRFGNDHLVSTTLLNELRDGRNVRTPAGLLKLSDDLRNIYMVLKSTNQLHEIDTHGTVSDVIKRLPAYCRDEWTKRAVVFRRENSKYPDYRELMAYVVEASEDANDLVYGDSVFVRDGPVHHRYKGNDSAFNTSARPLCPVCDADHPITSCDQFKGMTVKMRRQTASDHGLCYNCLCKGHFIINCHSKFTCGVQGCDNKHNTYLHEYSNVIVNNSCSTVNESVDVYMPVVRVLVNGSYTAHALLDTASTTSFCSKYIADKLGLKGSPTDFQLSTLTGSSTKVTNMVSVNLSTISGDNARPLACYVVNQITAHTPPVDISKYDYLQNLRFPCNVRVDFLIGQDNAGLLVPFEVRHGIGNQPFATRTLYGWCLNGPVMTSRLPTSGVCNYVHAHVGDSVDRLCEIDYPGINCSKQGNSRDDIKVLELKDQKCKFEEWKQDRSRWTASWGSPEVKQEALSNVDAVQQVLDLTHPVDKRSQHVPNWMKLQRTVAWLKLIRNRYKSGTRNKSIKSEMMSYAELTIMRDAQKMFYGEKIEALRRTRSVKRSRSLSKLMLRSWINGANSTIKKESKNRINCRKKIVKPMRQKIADQLLRSRNQPE